MKIALRTQFFGSHKSKYLVIFFHGMFGSAFGNEYNKTRYERLTSHLVDKNIAVGLYETGRNSLRKEGDDFMEWAKKSFARKTFAEELEEVKSAMGLLAKNSSGSKLFFVGFSVGGTFSTYLLSQFHPEAVLMFGSGCETRSKDMPIGSSYPNKEEILANLKIYKGILKIYQGTDDQLVPKSGALRMIRAAKKARRRDFIQLLDVDHQFIKMDNLNVEKKLDEFIVHEIKNVIWESNFLLGM